MSVWQGPVLSGRGGELVAVWIPVDPRDLEDLLEALAELPFPVNPEIDHAAGVTFPAYDSDLDSVRDVLRVHGFDPQKIEARGLLTGEPAS
ncbi:MAG: hypothetical protein FJW40_26975 [Acidobacteria bacterium]|nr:hypothetical protein [Acidobacteriota bacterium]